MKPRVALEDKGEKTALDPEDWVEKHGDVLFGFAAARVRDRAIAEDLVQETFLGALKSKAAFAGRSNERAWLFGILRNKLVDYYRRQKREVLFGDDETFSLDEVSFTKDGFRKGSWHSRLAPQAWETPDETLSKKEFQAVLHKCMSRLPERMGALFRMREIDAVSFEQICEELEISANNASVLLHRARMSLRRCLEVRWFSPGIRNKQSPRTTPGKGDTPS